jgi:tRNA threonylcarbamoyladenosine biosynthesis protein TsaB
MILTLNTATETFSVALADETGAVIKGVSVRPEPGSKRVNHSDVIIPHVQKLLGGKDLKSAGVKKIACTVGPGSFTGIRIGLTFARCACQYYGLPLAGCKTHFAAAQRIKMRLDRKGEKVNHLVCVLMPASMNEVYASLFCAAPGKAAVKEIFPCRVFPGPELKKYLSMLAGEAGNLPVVVTGDWVPKNIRFLNEAGIKTSSILEDDKLPSYANALATLAPRLRAGPFYEITPFYIQPPRLR